MWPLLIPLLSNLLDKVLPDKGASDAAKLELVKLAQSGQLAEMDAQVRLITAQTDINKVEAASSSILVAGARPAIMWVCGAAMAFKFIGGPALFVLAQAVGHPITLPSLDFSEMNTVLMGMLGLGAMRTVEKIKGVS